MSTEASTEASLEGSGDETRAVGSNQKTFRLEEYSPQVGNLKIWVLHFDLQGEKVNKLNQRVMSEFEGILPRLQAMGHQKDSDGNPVQVIDALILRSGKKGNFIAGADIEMIQATRTAEEAQEISREGQKLADQWEDLPFPTIAAINGAALGGGCELGLASTAMVMSDDASAKVGLPEVLLGLIPGMGGTIRLPRKVGIATALDLILTGKSLNGERAFKAGLADACLPWQNFDESVVQWTAKNISALRVGRRIGRAPMLGGMGGPMGRMLEKTPMKSIVFKKARDSVFEKTKGQYPAPLEALDVIQETAGMFEGFFGDMALGPISKTFVGVISPVMGDLAQQKIRGKARENAMIREASGFGRMAASEVSKNLIRLFFLTEGVKKSKGLAAGSTTQALGVHKAAVLGAGVMGGGIAQLFAEKNIPTRMKDLGNVPLSLGMKAAGQIFQKQVKRRRLTQRQAFQKMNYIAPVVDYSGFQSCELVVEAIVENLDIKKKVFVELENQVSADCILASNTSSLSVSKMQTGLKNPGRLVGMHFFNPVNKMPLVEVIRGEKTSDTAVATIFQLSKMLGKTPIVVKDAPGFLVNRLLLPYLNEAVHLVAEGVSILEIDRVLLAFGMPMGPLELIDEVGLDVGDKVGHILHDAFGERMAPAAVSSKVVAAGRLGKKSGKGIYEYNGPKKEKSFNPEIYTILGVQPTQTLSDEEILERCLLPMINEAARCLEEKVVATADQVDLGMIMGTGFPPFRGGLLRYADSLGVKTLVDRLKMHEAKLGARFTPAPVLVLRAQNDQKFYSQS